MTACPGKCRAYAVFDGLTGNRVKAAFRKQRGKFSGLVAEAIQHEMDHFEGKLI